MIKKWRCTIVWLVSVTLLGVAPLSHAAQVELHAAHRGISKQGTQLVFSLRGNPSLRYFSLTNPQRVVLDLKHTAATRWNSSTLSRALAVPVRASRRRDDLHVVLTTPLPLQRVFVLPRDAKHPLTRVVVELARSAPERGPNIKSRAAMSNPVPRATPVLAHAAAPVVRQVPTTPVFAAPHKESGALPTPVVRLSAQSRPLRKVIILIDPGHGGKDSGALGARGSQEKNVVLAISRELQELVNRQPGMQAVMTRSNDSYIPLRERLHKARQYKADVFIAIHADAYRNTHLVGSSVYALSARGATSEAARWLAEKENYSELGGVDLNNKSNLLRSVLLDLSQTATIGASLQLGNSILNSLHQITSLHRRRVEQAPFVVLKSPDIPSVLVETGFISNPTEEARLIQSWYQRSLAQAIFKGLNEYCLAHPPADSWLAQRTSRYKQHVVQSGETLDIVAKHYGISRDSLRRLNGLTQSLLNEGQVLRIPSRWFG